MPRRSQSKVAISCVIDGMPGFSLLSTDSRFAPDSWRKKLHEPAFLRDGKMPVAYPHETSLMTPIDIKNLEVSA